MPKGSNIIQFSLNENQRDKLTSLSLEGESLGLTAKRILLTVLEGNSSDVPSSSNESSIIELSDRITAIEIGIERELYQNDRVINLESEVELLATTLEHLQTELEILKTTGQPPTPDSRQGLCTKSLTGESDDREKDGLTSRELARRLGKHPSTVLRWREREGGRDPLGRWVYKPSLEKWFSL